MAIANAMTAAIMNVIVAIQGAANVDVSKLHPKQIKCLADNIYFESRGETTMDKIVVANVTLNRLKDKRFPKTICKVVYQPEQFSWVGERKKVEDFALWHDCMEIATLASAGLINDYTNGALYFHRKDKRPIWAKQLEVVKVNAVGGKHIILKERS